MTKILVTGASGFVGRHLVSRLLADGHQVRGTSRHPQPDQGQGVEWIWVPTLDAETDWSRALAEVEIVIHLAALAHQVGTQGEGHAEEFMAVNGRGTESLSKAIASSPSVRRMVFLSSIGAVRSFSSVPLSEDSPCQPDNDYGRSKLAAESAVQAHLHGIHQDWCILRPCLIFGPDNPGNMARLASLLRTGLPLPFKSIRSRRSYAYVENLVDALVRAMNHPEASRRIFLYSDPGSIEFPELLREIGHAATLKVRLFPFPMWGLRALGRIGDSLRWMTGRSLGVDSYSIQRLVGDLEVDGSAFRNRLGWTPPVGLKEAVRRTFKPGAQS